MACQAVTLLHPCTAKRLAADKAWVCFPPIDACCRYFTYSTYQGKQEPTVWGLMLGH
jgi:hypothetical protein